VLRRAGRFDDAIASAAKAEEALELAGGDDEADDGAPMTAMVAAFVRGLAEAGDDSGRSVADAFAGE
jgi:hypothetical protein